MDEPLSIADLRELLTYDPGTGILVWKAREPKWFASTGKGGSAGACARWNGRFANKQTFTQPAKDGGHLCGRILWKGYRAQRVIWAMVHGKWPSEHIDHIDGDPRNNRIDNLRDVSRQTNMMNRRRQSNNTSGATGVCRSGNKWWASIKHKGRKHNLGFFSDLEDARAARKKAETELGFSPRHGL